jgi:branched-chain amino acid transport system substrate-binding protein
MKSWHYAGAGLTALAVVAALSLSGGCRKQDGKVDAKVKVGVLTPLSGEASAYGTYTRQGLELALTEIEDPPFELVYKDTKADPLEAVRVFKELAREGVPVVVGPFTSTEVRQVGPDAMRTKTALITSSATADDLSKLGDYVFMMLPPNSQQGADQARFALDALKVKRAGILYRQNPYGETLRAAFTKTFKEGGGEVVADVGFADGEENFRDRLKEIAKAKPDILFAPAHDADTGRILRQAREVNLPKDVRVLGCDGSMSPTMLELAGEAAEGAIFSNVASVSKEFDEAYRKAHDKEPNPYAASSYDSLKILYQLMKQGARSGSDFQKALKGMEKFEGTTGPTKFTLVDKSYWALSKTYRQFEVKKGKFELRR